MPSPTRPGTTRQVFDSVEEFSLAARGMGLDVDFHQTRSGPASVSVDTTHGETLRIARYRVTAPTIRQGAPRRGVVSFWIRDAPTTPSHWCGQWVDGPGVSVFPDEFYASGSHHHDGTVVEIEHHRLSLLAESEGIALDPADLRGPTTLLLEPRRLAALASLKDALMANDPTWARAQTEADLALGLLRATRSGHQRTRRPRIAARQQAFSRARQYIDAYAAEELTSADLCTAARVSQRTLEYAFRDFTGLTPKAYVKVVRLNRCRASLRRAQPGARIADIANQWGFWHMGQFARDFQRMFGRQPRDELAAGGARV